MLRSNNQIKIVGKNKTYVKAKTYYNAFSGNKTIIKLTIIDKLVNCKTVTLIQLIN